MVAGVVVGTGILSSGEYIGGGSHIFGTGVCGGRLLSNCGGDIDGDDVIGGSGVAAGVCCGQQLLLLEREEEEEE